MKLMMILMTASFFASISNAVGNPLNCDQSPYWVPGYYELMIDRTEASKEDVFLALDTLHYTGLGKDFANLVITRSHSYNQGQVIEFWVTGLGPEGRLDTQSHNDKVSEIVNTLSDKPGLILGCAYMKPGGVLIHN